MNKKVFLTALALALGGVAGAQCIQPVITPLPRMGSTGLGMNGATPWVGDNKWSTTAITGTGTSGLNGTDVQGFWTTLEDQSRYSFQTPATKSQVKYMKFMATFNNNAGLLPNTGSARTIEISYGGKVYARIVSSPSLTPSISSPQNPNKDYGFIYAEPRSGAQVFDKSGLPASQTDPNNYAPAGTLGVVMNKIPGGDGGLLGDNGADPARLTDATQFFLLLPDTIPATGDLQMTSVGYETGYASKLYVDDIVVYKPETVPTTFCLEKTSVNKAPLGVYDFTTTERGSNPQAQQINVTTAGTAVKQDNAYQVYGDYIDVREMTTGTYGISSIRCQSDLYQNPNGSPTPYLVRPETSVNTITTIPNDTGYTTPLGTKGFRVQIPSGTQTVCSIVNDGTPAAQLTTNKKFDKGRAVATDQATITETSGANKATYATTGAGSTVAYTLTDDKRVVSPPTTYNTPAATTKSDSIAVSGPPKLIQSIVTSTRDNAYTMSASEVVPTPSNYTSTYACTNATAGSTTTMPSGSGSSLSITGAKFGDNITCTFTNTSLIAPVTTTINTLKTGATYVTQGQNLTYTIMVSVPSAASSAATNVVVSDPLPTGATFVSANPAATTAPAVGSNGTVTWNLGTLAKGTTQTLQVTVQAPAAMGAAGSQTLSTNTLTNTATVTTDTVTDSSSSLTATKTSYVMFAGIAKQVRNVTTGGTLGNSANAKPGDTLEYCLNYTNYSGEKLDQLTIKDTLNNGQTIVANGEGSGDFKITRGSTVTYGSMSSNTSVSYLLSNVQKGETGSLCFQALIPKS